MFIAGQTFNLILRNTRGISAPKTHYAHTSQFLGIIEKCQNVVLVGQKWAKNATENQKRHWRMF